MPRYNLRYLVRNDPFIREAIVDGASFSDVVERAQAMGVTTIAVALAPGDGWRAAIRRSPTQVVCTFAVPLFAIVLCGRQLQDEIRSSPNGMGWKSISFLALLIACFVVPLAVGVYRGIRGASQERTMSRLSVEQAIHVSGVKPSPFVGPVSWCLALGAAGLIGTAFLKVWNLPEGSIDVVMPVWAATMVATMFLFRPPEWRSDEESSAAATQHV